MNINPQKPVLILGLLVLVGMIVIVLVYGYFAPETRPCSRLANFPFPCGQSQVEPQVDLSIGTLDLNARRLTGTAQLNLRSKAFPSQVWEDVKNRGKVVIFLEQSLEPGRYNRIGRSTAQIELTELPSQELTGDGSFWWNVDTLRSEFWYPFDRYKVVLNPRLVVPDAGKSTFSMYPISQLRLTMSGPDLYMEIFPVKDNNPLERTYEVVLERSLFIRITSALVLVMALFFIIFCILWAKIDQLVWQSLAFFATIWGIRVILRGNLPFSSIVLMDYMTILIFGTIAVNIVVRWLKYQRS